MENRLSLLSYLITILYYPKSIKALTVLILAVVVMCSCEKEPVVQAAKPYTGPTMVVYQITTVLTDSAQPKITMKAPEQIEYENGNRIFPKGVNMEFFGEANQKSSILTAKYGKYNKQKNLYTVTNNVVIVNKEEGKTLNTEELHWNPGTKKIFTDKFVRIETPTELLTGTGLESNEDFSTYRILKVSGVFPLNE